MNKYGEYWLCYIHIQTYWILLPTTNSFRLFLIHVYEADITGSVEYIEENKKPNPYIDRALPKKPF